MLPSAPFSDRAATVPDEEAKVNISLVFARDPQPKSKIRPSSFHRLYSSLLDLFPPAILHLINSRSSAPSQLHLPAINSDLCCSAPYGVFFLSTTDEQAKASPTPPPLFSGEVGVLLLPNEIDSDPKIKTDLILQFRDFSLSASPLIEPQYLASL
ncbi:hypothetical protein LXL04_001492 [Taraxacum kok-saghyz]